jgi:hypothetical protein
LQLARLSLAAFLVLLAAPSGSADLRPWNQERATALARDLVPAASELYDAFYKQPQPAATPRARRDYERLKRDIRRIKNEARGLAADLERGEGRDQTLTAWKSLATSVRWAQERARSVFTTQDVQERAAAVRQILRELAPFYDPEEPDLR